MTTSGDPKWFIWKNRSDTMYIVLEALTSSTSMKEKLHRFIDVDRELLVGIAEKRETRQRNVQ